MVSTAEHHHHEKELADKTYFGFWVYLMTDCILFSVLFVTFGILHDKTFGGPSGKELFSLPFVLGETMALLVSSFVCGPAMLAAVHNRKYQTIFWLILVFLLGALFLGMELKEFSDFVREGNSWQRSAFLSSFFTLVGTHGIHITCGLIWVLTLMGQIAIKGLTPSTHRRLTCFRMFWHFLDVVWIFIFTIVYLMGVL
jgi:cytochrome o ubiquinol oxidase subunit 3